MTLAEIESREPVFATSVNLANLLIIPSSFLILPPTNCKRKLANSKIRVGPRQEGSDRASAAEAFTDLAVLAWLTKEKHRLWQQVFNDATSQAAPIRLDPAARSAQ